MHLVLIRLHQDGRGVSRHRQEEFFLPVLHFSTAGYLHIRFSGQIH